jgi:hypothetical protein
MSRPALPPPTGVVVPADGTPAKQRVMFQMDATPHPSNAGVVLLSMAPADGGDVITLEISAPHAMDLASALVQAASTWGQPIGCDDARHGANLVNGSCVFCGKFVAGGSAGGRA